MLEKHSAAEIGQYNYTHWTSEPVTPGAHKMRTVPQTIADGFEGYCSCGEWRGFASFYEFPTRETLKAALDSAHAAHVHASPNPRKAQCDRPERPR